MIVSLFLTTLAFSSNLSPELRDFLGPSPAGFEKNFVKPAKQLRAAVELRTQEKSAAAIPALLPLATHSEFAEHATFELALAYRAHQEFGKSTAQALRFGAEFPGSVYADRLPDLIRDNDCDAGLAESKKATGPKSRTHAAAMLERCLARISWKEWSKREEQVTELYKILARGKNDLLGAFVAEVIQALPAGSPLRAKIAKEIPDAKLNEYANLARYRAKNPNPAGVKATYPDADLFDQGMQAVLQEKWSDANTVFKKLAADFPQSERLDSANYWIARTEEKIGNAEAAKARYEQIYADSPLSYYGLQSGFRLKKDPLALVQAARPSPAQPLRLTGGVTTRQQRSLWRLRALLEAGLTDLAREEAKFFFQYRPSGAAFGQEDSLGALLTAKLFTAAGYPLAAFSHAYSAVSFNKDLFNNEALGLIFPRSFEKEFADAAAASGVHPLLLYSVAKQESAFIPNAVSRADALGLLQLLPSTAQEMKSDLVRTELFDPAVNSQLGGRYLRKLLDRFQGNIAVALAGYNAGPSRAQQWQKLWQESSLMRAGFDLDVFVDTIPFTETRKYVSSIFRNFAWYKLLENNGKIESLQELVNQWQNPPSKIENPTPPTPSTPKNSDTSAPIAE